jgi:hypothetical protein
MSTRGERAESMAERDEADKDPELARVVGNLLSTPHKPHTATAARPKRHPSGTGKRTPKLPEKT